MPLYYYFDYVAFKERVGLGRLLFEAFALIFIIFSFVFFGFRHGALCVPEM